MLLALYDAGEKKQGYSLTTFPHLQNGNKTNSQHYEAQMR